MNSGRILCVDDDCRINELNRIALSRLGYEVVTASSPTDALERLGASRFDLVITDLFRPAAADVEFLAKLRNLAPTIRIILVSGDHDPPGEILKQTDLFIEKAYSVSALTDSVRRMLNRDKLRRIG